MEELTESGLELGTEDTRPVMLWPSWPCSAICRQERVRLVPGSLLSWALGFL